MDANVYRVSLKAARVNIGLTLKQASTLIGISKTTLGKYESGTTSPTVQTLKKMCDVYRVPLDSISFAKEVY